MTEGSPVHVGVLGFTALAAAGADVALTPSQRRVLAALVMAREDSTPQRLIDLVWGDRPPSSARPSLHNHIARLRQSLPDDAIQWDSRRYQLDDASISLDVVALEEACTTTRDRAAAGEHAAAQRAAATGLALWRGEPYADLADDSEAVVETERYRLAELHADLEELHVAVLFEQGDLSEAVTTLQALVRAKPEREQRWVELVVALAQAGRRAEALEAYREAEHFFGEVLGLRPPEALSRLRHRILRNEVPGAASPIEASPMVGRGGLLRRLETLLPDTQAMLLTGEAGIGKSTVLTALAEACVDKGLRTARVTCLTNPWSALQPVVDILSELRRDVRHFVPDPGDSVLRLLGQASPRGKATDGSGLDRSVLARQVSTALAHVAARRNGLVLLVDDAHRMGPTSHRLLLAALDASPLIKLVAATRHRDSLPRDFAERAVPVAVDPLDHRDLRSLITHELGDVEDVDRVADGLHALTGGNPLFATAVLLEARRDGELARKVSQASIHPPTDLEVPRRLVEVIETTIAALALPTRRALDVAAVLEDPLDEDLLLALTSHGSLERAIDAGILNRAAGGAVTFRHGLVHHVAYELVPYGRRVELHHVVATLLRERGSPASVVARHALQAAEVDPIAAVQSAVRAGRAAFETMAFEEAAHWYDQAADVLAADDATARATVLALCVEAADARRLAGLPGHAEALLDLAEEALEHDDDLRRRAVLAALQLGETGEVGPLQQRAAQLAARALEREQDRDVRAVISATASMVHSLSGEPVRCRALVLDALELLGDDPRTAVAVLPYAYMGLAHVADLPERAAAAARLCRDAAVVDDPVAQFEGWHLTFSVALQQADGSLVRSAHEQMRALLDRVGDAGRRWSFLYQEAAVAQLDGRLDDAERAAEQALEVGSGVAPSRAFGAYSGQLLELRRLGGRLAELVPLTTQLVADQDTLPAWKAVASFVLAESDPVSSRALFDELAQDSFAALPRDFAWLAAIHVLARGSVVRGDVEHAVAAAEALDPYADLACWQSTCSYGPVATVLAHVALLQDDRRKAATLGHLALDRATSLDAPPYVDEAREVLAAAGS